MQGFAPEGGLPRLQVAAGAAVGHRGAVKQLLSAGGSDTQLGIPFTSASPWRRVTGVRGLGGPGGIWGGLEDQGPSQAALELHQGRCVYWE